MYFIFQNCDLEANVIIIDPHSEPIPVLNLKEANSLG